MVEFGNRALWAVHQARHTSPHMIIGRWPSPDDGERPAAATGVVLVYDRPEMQAQIGRTHGI